MIHFQDDHVTLHLGDAIDVAREMPDESVDCIVTSPPYFGLRDYGVEGQYGLEPTPDEYAKTLRTVFAELKRVLAKDGTLWLNVGDSYGRGSRSATHPLTSFERANGGSIPRPKGESLRLPNKSLLGIPWRVAFALQDDGWILRNDIIWAKNNGMPTQVKDRLANKHEHLFLFARSQKYHFDLDPIRPPANPNVHTGHTFGGKNKAKNLNTGSSARLTGRTYTPTGKGRNPGDVWTINTTPFPEAHFATFPVELPRRCILAGCKPGGTVLDPFSGAGTTGKAAIENGRRYVGIDISAEYLDLSLRTRLSQDGIIWE